MITPYLAPRIYEGGVPVRTLGRGEYVLYSVFYFIVYYSANTIKIFINICITKANYFQSKIFQALCAKLIFFLRFLIIVTAAVQLDHQFCTKAIEIYNVMIYTLLPLKSNGIVFKK